MLPQPFFPAPGELDDSELAAFLTTRWRRELLIGDVHNAVLRYAQIPERESATLQIEAFLAAAEKRKSTFAPIGSSQYVRFHHSISQTVPRGIYDGQPDVLRALESLPGELDLICQSASKRLSELKPPHRPQGPKRALVEELATAWTSRTRKPAGVNGETTWHEPKTVFAQFAKVAICMLPETSRGEFKIGFGGLIRRAVAMVSEPTQKI
jgi:hypothetical protein